MSSDVQVNLIDMWQANRPLAQTFDVARFNEDGYRRNAIIFSCIVLKAVSFMEPELLAYTDSQDNENEPLDSKHMLSQLLRRPNKRQSQSALFRMFSTHLDVAGNVYLHKLRNAARMPIRMQLLRPDVMRPIPMYSYSDQIVSQMKARGVDISQYDPGDVIAYAYGTEPNQQIIPASDVIHEQAHPDPLDPYHGLSPIAVLSRFGDLDNHAADYLRAFFLNAGIPSGILKFKSMKEGELTKSQRDRVQEQWRSKYNGIKGWFDVFVTDADVEYEEVGSKLKSMDLEQVFGETECRICGTFGVHPVLVAAWIGLLRSTMANFEQARKAFYQQTLKPTWISMADRFTVDLAAEFGENIYTAFDLDNIDALQEDKDLIWNRATKAFDSGVITRGRAKEMIGEEVEDGDEVYKYSTSVQLIEEGELPMLPVAPDQNAGVQEELMRLRSSIREVDEKVNSLDPKRQFRLAK